MKTNDLLIDRTTTIRHLLALDEHNVIEALAGLNKNFRRLKNPVLRRILAARVTIEDACRIAGCNVPDFLHTMQALGFVLNESGNQGSSSVLTTSSRPPAAITIELDVRPILADGKDPLKAILNKLNELKEGFALKIINTFEPLPLIHLLSQKGYTSSTQIKEKDYVETLFYRPADAMPASPPPPEPARQQESFDEVATRFEGHLKVIDVRALEMPGPMATILDTLDTLADGEALFVHHKKKPVYLLPHLHHKGFNYQILEAEENNVKLLIYRS